jgi:hypothetical protein
MYFKATQFVAAVDRQPVPQAVVVDSVALAVDSVVLEAEITHASKVEALSLRQERTQLLLRRLPKT